MPQTAAQLDRAFAALREVLKAGGENLLVTVDKAGDFQVCDPKRTDRIGRPLFAAAVQTRKNYVAYHLMGVYTAPDLAESLSPSLQKRLRGKACFNFTTVDAAQVEELKALTKIAMKRLRETRLPWAR
jgi:hypothetical protein